MNKILIAEPIYHAMRPDVYFNRIAFWQETFAEAVTSGIQWFKVRSMIIGPRNAIRVARDKAIRTAVKWEATHLFFLDDDILVPPDILAKLLAVDKPIVGGLIHRDNGDPLVWKDVPGGEEIWHNHPTKGAFECAAVPAGCMLIKVEVLKRLLDEQHPLYGYEPEKGYAVQIHWLFNYDETDRSMDVRFCRIARGYGGATVWCFPDEKCVQVSEYPTT